jgi:hypothetical protein
MNRIADLLQVAALVVLVIAAFDVARPLGLAAVAVTLLIIGIAVDPLLIKRPRGDQ